MQLPIAFLENMKQLLSEEEYQAYLQSFDAPRHLGLRANTCKLSPDTLQEIAPFALSPVPWCDSGFYYSESERPAKHPYYHAGLYYLQEPSAMAPAALLPVSLGERVLDICAAPGGKATQLAAKLHGTGVLVANDISAGRAKSLLKNIELAGVRNALVVSEAPARLAKCFPSYFDKILIDAPCSGEGMFRKEPDMVKSWNEELLAFCQEQQADILSHCADMLRPGGMLLYSTCTFAVHENEESIAHFLETHTDFSLIPIEKKYGFAFGAEPLPACARLYPHRIQGEGHFLALLQKTGSSSTDTMDNSKPKITKPPTAFAAFANDLLTEELTGDFQLFGEHLCLMPQGIPDTKGLRVLRSGWQLGTLKKDRFTPAQAFAMGLTKNQVKRVLDFPLSDPRVLRYLKGETLETPNAEDGWTLICVDSYPLGWGKVSCGRVKNKYAVSWKWE